MIDSCQDFRDRFLEREDSAARKSLDILDHPARCAECDRWMRRVGLQVDHLSSLPRVSAPEALDAAVNLELELVEGRIARAVGGLPRLPAPAELEARMRGVLAETGETWSGLQPVEGLEKVQAPEVLERLVGEELAAPAAHRTERFVGNLELVRAPRGLERRIAERFERALPALRWVGALTALAAASIVVVLVLHDRDETGRRPPLIRAASLNELDPLARGLAFALGGVEEGGPR